MGKEIGGVKLLTFLRVKAAKEVKGAIVEKWPEHIASAMLDRMLPGLMT